MFRKLFAGLFLPLLILTNSSTHFARIAQDPSQKDETTTRLTSAQNIRQEGTNRPLRTNANAGERLARRTEPADRRRALHILSRLLEQAKGFKEDGHLKPIKVILIQAQIAYILWDYDQKRARQLFTDAFNAADLLRPGQPQSRFFSGPDDEMHLLLRKEIFRFLLRRDSNLAEKLVTSIARPVPKPGSKKSPDNMELLKEQATLNLQIAISIADSDPERAARLIKRSLNGWLSYKHIEALQALRNQSPAQADELFLNALTLVRNKPSYLTNKIGLLAPYVFPDIRNEANIESSSGRNLSQTIRTSPTLIVPFLEFVYDTFMQQPAAYQTSEINEFGMASFDYFTMRELLPHFDRHLPDKAAEIRGRVEEIIADIKQNDRQDIFDRESEVYQEFFQSSVQDLIDKAETAKEQREKDYFYYLAATLLVWRDDKFEQAVPLIEKISDEQERLRTTSTLGEIAASIALKKGDAERAYSYIRESPDSADRLHLLIAIADRFAAKKEYEKARWLLREAEKLISKATDARDNAHALILIADVAVSIDPSLGFQAMKSAVEADNHITRSNDFGHGIGEDGKIILGMTRFDRGQSFSLLARADFNRALQLAQQIRDKEASVVAQLAVCRGILER
ncbi:MAG TPA: hypothetical protein VNO70_06145 [Blastocatellia bacterium]|nr:hypothetical protein [Blastocatellia bacterium]